MVKYIRSFGEMTKGDFQTAGGKAANLGELTQNGFNVPMGFCVTSNSLSYLVEENHLQKKIDSIIATFTFENFKDSEEKSAKIRDLIIQAKIPSDLLQEIHDAVAQLNTPSPPFVAVRSSVAVKDSEISSFPGMMDTYHYIKGEAEIIDHIKQCWASLWTNRAIITRYRKGIDQNKGLIAPVVQKMVHSDVAGVMFTANPITNSREEIVIEANWGLGESVVSGKSMNDFYLMDKDPLKLKDKRISKKNIIVGFDEDKGFGRKEMELSAERAHEPTLSDDQIIKLGDTGLKIEDAFGYPQDIEWAYEKEELFILQSRNIRNLKESFSRRK